MNERPLPLIDGNTFFCDNTTLEYITTCPRSAEYYVCYGKIGAEERPYLNFGSALHAALEHRHRNYGRIAESPCGDEINTLLTNWFTKNPNPVMDYRQLPLATGLMAGYLKKYPTEPMEVAIIDGKRAVELPFAYPLATIRGINVIWDGKIDVVWRAGRELWVMDHKSTSIGGPNEMLAQEMSPQWKGYCWALYKATGVLPTGAIINQIRARHPTKAAQEEAAGIATPTQGDSLSDMLASAKKKKARQPVEPDDFTRQPFLLQHWMLDEWMQNTIASLDRFFAFHEQGFFPMTQPKHCINKYGKCQFLDICQQPPDQRIKSLSGPLCADNTFSPLNRVAAIKPQQQNETITNV